MTNLRIVDGDVVSTRAQALVVGIADDKGLHVVSGALPTTVRRSLVRDLQRIGCTAAVGQTWRIPAPEGIAAESVLLVGIVARPNPEQVREAAGAALRAANGAKTVAVALPCPNASMLAAVCEGALLGALNPLRISSAKPAPEVATVVVATTAPRSVRLPVKRAVGIDVDAAALTRDLVNQPPGHLNPKALAAIAKRQLKGLPVKVTVWNPDRLAKERMGGILAVGQGSANPPCLIQLEYSPAKAHSHLALVGKGITFDSGGLSLKPAKSMETMKCDMGGAAAVLAATRAIAQEGLPIRVSAFLACAENMPSGTAQRPGDVITMRDGTTVEVVNTDAEGRLVMADALALACEATPDAVVDVATLTGAQMVALGTRVAAVMSNDQKLSKQVQQAGESVGEAFWPMPLPEALKPGLKTPVADLKNMGEQFGGMLTAGLFLQHFVSDDIPWAHLDIAGPAFNESGPYGFIPKGATGFAARTLVALARSMD